MKNITIVTWYYSCNYGTLLQAFALQKYLSCLGYNVNILNHFHLNNSIKSIFKRGFGILGLIKIVRFFRFFNKKNLRRCIKKELNEKFVFTHSQYRELIRNTDVFISGSDQIWNTYYCFDPFYFLDFAADKKRVAYASSIGTCSVDPAYEDEVSKLLSKYSCIGVREESAVRVLSGLTRRNDIKQVLDPTFLLNEKHWKDFGNIANYDFNIPERYMLCYFIGNNDEYSSQLEDVKIKCKIDNVIIIPSIENFDFKMKDAIIYENAGPKEFVNLIARSSLVCTDSFHATALSINMSKDFVEFKRFRENEKESQNSRLNDLLNHYGLKSRYYSSSVDWQYHIEYETIQTLLQEDRVRSNEFLINAIES